MKISLDDFGTAYSSLSYLHSFPFHKVKIDQSFLRGLVDDERRVTLLRGMTRLSAQLGLHVVVEGVETEEQLELLLSDDSIDEAQGYLLCRPMPASDVRKLLYTAYVAPASRPAASTRCGVRLKSCRNQLRSRRENLPNAQRNLYLRWELLTMVMARLQSHYGVIRSLAFYSSRIIAQRAVFRIAYRNCSRRSIASLPILASNGKQSFAFVIGLTGAKEPFPIILGALFSTLTTKREMASYSDFTLTASWRVQSAFMWPPRIIPTLPHSKSFPIILQPELDAGKVIVDTTRFVTDETFSRLYRALPYATMRVAGMACEYFQRRPTLAAVRREHQAFYRRIVPSPRGLRSATLPRTDKAAQPDDRCIIRPLRTSYTSVIHFFVQLWSNSRCFSGVINSRHLHQQLVNHAPSATSWLSGLPPIGEQ